MGTNVVIVVDEDSLERRYLAAALAADGFDVLQRASPIEGILAVIDSHPGLVVLAEESEPLDLGQVLLLLHRLTSSPIIIVGNGGSPRETESLGFGADFYLNRPLTASSFLLRVRALLGRERRQTTEGFVRVGFDQQTASSRSNGRAHPAPDRLTA